MTLRTVRALFEAHEKADEREKKMSIAMQRIAQHADAKGYKEFLKDVFG
jgi:hypothetical protein